MDYLGFAKEIVEKAGAGGAEAEVFINIGKETNIEISRGNVEKLSQSGSKGLGVRVIAEGGRVGYAYTSDFSPGGVERTWQGALAIAEAADPDPNRALPDPQPFDGEDLAIYDPAIAEMRAEEKIDFAKRIEKAALDYDARVIMTNRCIYFDNVTSVYLVNSRGFAGVYDRSVIGGYVFAIARDEKGINTNGIGVGAGTKKVEVNPETIGREAGARAVAQLDAVQVETQVGTVVLDPLVTAEFLAYLSAALTAESMQRKRSFLLDKMGQEVANDRVTILDNGRMPGGLASAPFDGEGVPTQVTRLIDEGVLQNVIYDTYSAKLDGASSTGNAQRGSHRSKPRLALSNFYLQPGNQSQEDIIAGVKKGLYVTSTMGAGVSPITGEYSVGASGTWIEDGKLTYPVKEATIASTMGDILKNIVAVGSDARVLPFFGAIIAPTIRIEGMTIGGK
ncbi:MAG: TldD/PmbA family protein [Anaerolineae bacterium]|nr:TldD/PmbA family protein [Anaerolineae bacterium]